MSDNDSKSKLIGYWVATALICLQMTGGAIAELLRVEDMLTTFDHLGYPTYLLTILGVAKLLSVPALLAPGFARLKEWAYAGITFDLLGASASHSAVKDAIPDIAVPLVMLTIALTSYALRPDSRRLASSLSN